MKSQLTVLKELREMGAKSVQMEDTKVMSIEFFEVQGTKVDAEKKDTVEQILKQAFNEEIENIVDDREVANANTKRQREKKKNTLMYGHAG